MRAPTPSSSLFRGPHPPFSPLNGSSTTLRGTGGPLEGSPSNPHGPAQPQPPGLPFDPRQMLGHPNFSVLGQANTAALRAGGLGLLAPRLPGVNPFGALPLLAAGGSLNLENFLPPHRASPVVPSLHQRILKTKLCVHHLHGRCARGAKCTFAHSVKELRKPPNLYKTRLCINFTNSGSCPKGDQCRFAHGEPELRPGEEDHEDDDDEDDQVSANVADIDRRATIGDMMGGLSSRRTSGLPTSSGDGVHLPPHTSGGDDSAVDAFMRLPEQTRTQLMELVMRSMQQQQPSPEISHADERPRSATIDIGGLPPLYEDNTTMMKSLFSADQFSNPNPLRSYYQSKSTTDWLSPSNSLLPSPFSPPTASHLQQSLASSLLAFNNPHTNADMSARSSPFCDVVRDSTSTDCSPLGASTTTDSFNFPSSDLHPRPSPSDSSSGGTFTRSRVQNNLPQDRDPFSADFSLPTAAFPSLREDSSPPGIPNDPSTLELVKALEEYLTLGVAD